VESTVKSVEYAGSTLSLPATLFIYFVA